MSKQNPEAMAAELPKRIFLNPESVSRYPDSLFYPSYLTNEEYDGMVEYVRAQPVAAESASDNVKECLLQMQTANIDLVKQIKELETERDTYAEAATTWAGRFHASKQKIDTLQAEAAKLREKLELLKGCWNDIKPLDCRKEDFEQRLFDDRQKRVLAFNNAILAIEKEKPNELVE